MLGAYFYAKEHANNEDISVAIKKGILYINDNPYSVSLYEFPYNYIVLPIFGLLMIGVIILLIKAFKENINVVLALHKFNASLFTKLLAIFIAMSALLHLLSNISQV